MLLYLTADKSFVQAELHCGFKVYCSPSFLKGEFRLYEAKLMTLLLVIGLLAVVGKCNIVVILREVIISFSESKRFTLKLLMNI